MIPKDFITEWRPEAPWVQDSQVEQDLVISRALVEMFSVPEIAERLAFRGGTALYKLHLRPAARYSEDIDLVQVEAEPIGETLDMIRGVLDPWLSTPQRTQKQGRVNLNYRFESEDMPATRMRLKVEINSREHFTELGLIKVPIGVDNRWFSGAAEITSFELDELLGTKLRALYQRKKGRDLFDLWHALEQAQVDVARLVACFDRYMSEGGHRVTRAELEANLHRKSTDRDFRADMGPLLRPGVDWDFDEAMALVLSRVVAELPGDPWKGGPPRARTPGLE